ncbi:MAG: hypothetical protein RIC56_07635 [Pseudomonadales bacterium]
MATVEVDYVRYSAVAIPAIDDRLQIDRRSVHMLDARPALRHMNLDTAGFTILRSGLDGSMPAEHLASAAAETVARYAGADRCIVYAINLSGASEPWLFANRPRLVHGGPTPGLARKLAGWSPTAAEDQNEQHCALLELSLPRAGHKALRMAWVHGQTIRRSDLQPVSIPQDDGRGELVSARFNSDHVWFQLPQIAPDEALLRKTWDTRTDGRARWSIACALDQSGTELVQMLLLARFDSPAGRRS